MSELCNFIVEYTELVETQCLTYRTFVRIDKGTFCLFMFKGKVRSVVNLPEATANSRGFQLKFSIAWRKGPNDPPI